MSCDYFPEKRVMFSALRRAASGSGPVTFMETEDSEARGAIILTDGENYVWAFKTQNGGAEFTRFGGNDPRAILRWVEETFDTQVYDEHQAEHFREELGELGL